jgi:hypothetical protein
MDLAALISLTKKGAHRCAPFSVFNGDIKPVKKQAGNMSQLRRMLFRALYLTWFLPLTAETRGVLFQHVTVYSPRGSGDNAQSNQ